MVSTNAMPPSLDRMFTAMALDVAGRKIGRTLRLAVEYLS